MENQVQRALRPIYNAIDLHQYSKALKLTQAKPQSMWPITIALKCHCLEQCGMYLEACKELRALVGVLGGDDDWSELDERIWLLSLDSSRSDNEAGGGGGASGTNGSNAGSNSVANSSRKKGKGGSKSKNKSSVPAAKVATIEKNSNCHLDLLDVLDLSISQRQKLVDCTVSKLPYAVDPNDVVDEHTIATISITTGALHLSETTSTLYSKAIKTISDSSNLSDIDKQQLCSLMSQGYLSILKQISDKISFSKREELDNSRSALKAWEEAQFLSMNLVKNSGEGLYQSWCVLATMEHFKSCKNLLTLLSSDSTLEEEQKLQKKVGMLPRLAEMIASKRVKTAGGEAGSFPPSVDDWRLLVECLVVQDKYDEAIKVVEGIDLKKTGERKINDETDVRNHIGSLVQLTEKEKMEMIVDLMTKSGRKEEAFDVYAKLLEMMPDQWTYWQKLLESSEDSERCENFQTCILDNQRKIKEAGDGPKVPLRGPHLFRLELLAFAVRSNGLDTLPALSQAIIDYGSLFAPLAFCCFQDLRQYIEMYVQKCDRKEDASDILSWAVELRKANDPTKSFDGDEDFSKKAERRKRLRAYIASVKICFEVWYQLLSKMEESSDIINKFLASFVPSPDEMIRHWKNTIDLGSNPKEGGQRECLPGDDLILLSTQVMLHNATCLDSEKRQETSFTVAATLEHALHYSPFNAYLKIAAINVHTDNGAAIRAWEIFQDMDVKQIQLDSCSYFILRHLIDNGLYKEAIEQATKIISLHSSSEKDVRSFMAKSIENGNLHKGREMINWQRNKMSQSLQLLEAKGLIMDLAPLLNFGNLSDPKSPPPIGALHGLCGGEHDAERAEKIIRDAANFYAAPSLIQLAGDDDCSSAYFSDNRDLTVNQFEILVRTAYDLEAGESFSRAHIHSVLTKLVLMSQVSKAPKKGKIVQIKEGEILDKRSRSLLSSIRNAEKYISQHNDLSKTHSNLWIASLELSKATCAIVSGRINSTLSLESSDSLAKREEKCIPLLNRACDLIRESTTTWKKHKLDSAQSICRLLPDILINTFAVFKTTASMCDKIGWGKRKRHTKPVAESLAQVAIMLKSLVDDMLSSFKNMYREEPKDIKSPPWFENLIGLKAIHEVVEHVTSNQCELKDRIVPLLKQMTDEFATFDLEGV